MFWGDSPLVSIYHPSSSPSLFLINDWSLSKWCFFNPFSCQGHLVEYPRYTLYPECPECGIVPSCEYWFVFMDYTCQANNLPWTKYLQSFKIVYTTVWMKCSRRWTWTCVVYVDVYHTRKNGWCGACFLWLLKVV